MLNGSLLRTYSWWDVGNHLGCLASNSNGPHARKYPSHGTVSGPGLSVFMHLDKLFHLYFLCPVLIIEISFQIACPLLWTFISLLTFSFPHGDPKYNTYDVTQYIHFVPWV